MMMRETDLEQLQGLLNAIRGQRRDVELARKRSNEQLSGAAAKLKWNIDYMSATDLLEVKTSTDRLTIALKGSEFSFLLRVNDDGLLDILHVRKASETKIAAIVSEDLNTRLPTDILKFLEWAQEESPDPKRVEDAAKLPL